MDDRQRWRRGWKLLLLLAGLLLGGVSGAWAQPAGPEMTVSAAWDGLVRKPGWVELLITLENESGDWVGEVVVEDQRWTVSYRLPVQLPAHAHKVYRLPVFLDSGGSAKVALLDAHGEETALQRVALHAYPFDARVCVAADPLTTMELEACDETLVLPQPAMMPEMASAWDAIDLLVMRDFPTSEMSEAQREALRAWVAAGGHLVLLEGPAMEAMVEGLPSSLRPSCESPTLVQGADGGALTVCRRTVGLGKVDRPRRDDPAALDALWATDHAPATAVPFLGANGETNTTLSAFFPYTYALFTTPRSAFPSTFFLPLFALVYFLLLIPLPYLITRRLHRPMLTWLLIPAMVLLASLCLFLWLSGLASHSFPITHEMRFVFVPDAEEPARVVSFGATLAPRHRRVRWSVAGFPRAGHGAFNIEYSLWMEAADPYAMTVRLGQKEPSVEANATRGIMTWGWEALTSAPALTMHGELGDQRYHLHVESEAPLQLQALLLYNRYTLPLEGTEITGGESINLSLPITAVETLPAYYSYPEEATPCMDALLNKIPYYGGSTLSIVPGQGRTPRQDTLCFLLAEMPGETSELPAARIEGSVARESCYVYLVPCPVGGIGRLVSLPPGNISVIEGDGWVDGILLRPGAGRSSVLNIHVPFFIPGEHLQRLQITLHLDSLGIPGEPTPTVASPWEAIAHVALWNWETEEWVEVKKPVDGESLEVAPAEAFINADRIIQMRLEGDPSLPAMTIEVAVQFEGE